MNLSFTSRNLLRLMVIKKALIAAVLHFSKYISWIIELPNTTVAEGNRQFGVLSVFSMVIRFSEF